MPTLATPEGLWLWSAVLALALFLPLRRLIFVLAMRRQAAGDEMAASVRRRLRWRAGVSAALLATTFAGVYVHWLAGRLYPPAP